MRFWIAVLLLCCGVSAQTISPVIGECGMKCQGEFTATNNTVRPMSVLIEPYSFTVADNKVRLSDVDKSTTDVQIDKTSVRLSPQGSYTFSYKVTCLKEPCRTQLVTKFMMGKRSDGVIVWLAIPHTVYSCSKMKDCRKRALQ
jgi:hypothetical protein